MRARAYECQTEKDQDGGSDRKRRNGASPRQTNARENVRGTHMHTNLADTGLDPHTVTHFERGGVCCTSDEPRTSTSPRRAVVAVVGAPGLAALQAVTIRTVRLGARGIATNTDRGPCDRHKLMRRTHSDENTNERREFFTGRRPGATDQIGSTSSV